MSYQEHTQIAAGLRAGIDSGRIADRDVEFARSLLTSFIKNGAFTARQEPYARRLALPPAAPTVLPDVSGILTLLQGAKARGLKRPGFTLRHAALDLRLTLAPDNGRNPGFVYIKLGGAYQGKIAPDGQLTIGPTDAALLAILGAMARDPVGTAAAHGHATGACCFCGRNLDDARSVTVGYGPVCAEKYGLPWGAKPALEPVRQVCRNSSIEGEPQSA